MWRCSGPPVCSETVICGVVSLFLCAYAAELVDRQLAVGNVVLINTVDLPQVTELPRPLPLLNEAAYSRFPEGPSLIRTARVILMGAERCDVVCTK
ncbi:hypothetical protein BDZ89DRAFT_1064596 [Hymenopellis radicata]|nr:hypothetical protein BDZ89DRAFT_1064596 [Hymenopellis radicata]